MVATLHVFILVMTTHRTMQLKIQEEIDQITGGKRLPELSDLESMPYVRCVILEVLRWEPVTPLGIPHLCDEEDEYNGYTIPKDSIVFGNVWAINRDETVYSNPDSFIPERFLDPTIPEPVSFGFGRRSCPGIHFAKSSLFINITTMLATFDIRPGRNAEGQEILPVVEMVQGVMAKFYEALQDPKTWRFALFSLSNNIPTPIGIQRSLIVESLGFTRFQVTLIGTLDGVIESMSDRNVFPFGHLSPPL